MKMSKTLKKLNDRLVVVINKLGVQASEELEGFVKLEHTVKFDLFPGSLLVSCYFESHDLLDKAMSSEKAYQKKLHNLLMKQGILLKEPTHNLKFYVTA
jgi:intracellular septation protein A